MFLLVSVVRSTKWEVLSDLFLSSVHSPLERLQIHVCHVFRYGYFLIANHNIL